MITRLIETFPGSDATTNQKPVVGTTRENDDAASSEAANPRRSGRECFPFLRLVDPERDLPLLNGWWQAQGLPPLPGRMPALGVIAEMDGEPVAAGFAVMSNCGCGLAMLQFLMLNPLAAWGRGPRGLNAVVEFLCAELRRMDYSLVMNVTRHGSLERLMVRHGFQKGDTGMTHYLKDLTKEDK